MAIAAVVFLWCLAARAGAAETVDLVPAVAADSLTHVDIVLQVGGEAQLMSEGKKTSLPMSVVANVSYDESLLSSGTSAGGARAVRYYDTANVAIKIAAGGQKPSLRADRRLIVASRDGAAIRLVSPTGPLLRDELDLIELPGSSLIVDELLPNRAVAVGDTWTHSADLLAALLGLDAASDVEISSRLEQVADGLAKVVLTGSLRGAVAGVGTEIELKAKYNFDLQTKRINYLAMLVKEKRSVGHVGPGLDVVAKLLVKVTPIGESVHLTPELIAHLPPASDEQSLLEYETPSHTFGFRYDRQWFVTSDEPNVAILRMIQRGELVAQCNMSAILTVQKEITLAAYQQDIQRSLDKNFGQFLKAAEESTPEGYRVFRVVAEGEVDGLPIQWIYYLLKSADGQQQASLAFTLEPGLVDRFGSADREFVSRLRFLTPPPKETKTASRRRD
ncbi:MAG TPA: hypothetical protein VHY91_25785 [Pirellulales bacterium]|jgi:hypothetical protein|nr:hypothetical protein [Pirellulales bacterium]